MLHSALFLAFDLTAHITCFVRKSYWYNSKIAMEIFESTNQWGELELGITEHKCHWSL